MSGVRVGAATVPLAGEVRVPGDKSIGHRALLLGALADGESEVRGFSGGADVRATLAAIGRLGAETEQQGDRIGIRGCGLALGAGTARHLDCANSGTTMRLGAGLVAGGPGTTTMDGDGSLRRRPMERIAEPLRRMGARVDTTDGHAPLTVAGGALTGIEWTLPVASAQVKSAVLLAGLRARGRTVVREPLPSRDHTERMLASMGVALERLPDGVALVGGTSLRPLALTLPGDPSSAAFLVVAALIVPGSVVRIRAVGCNPTRIGVLDILRRMGADIALDAAHDEAGEPCADLVVRASRLHGTTVGPAEVPAAIDELPILAVAAALAEGETRITGAAELRVKESDRLAALEQLGALGVRVTTTADGLVIVGSGGTALGSAGAGLRAPRIDPHGDHRIAMAFAVAGLRAAGGVAIADAACVDVSWPGFFDVLRGLGATVEAA